MGLAEAYNYVIAVCNDPFIGYSQTRRTTGTLGVTYNTYFDCSSLMSKAMTVGGYFTVCPWFTTDSQARSMAQAGWTSHDPKTTTWLAGDILWRTGHTEMCYQPTGTGGYTMGAHTDTFSFPDQVSINTTASNGSQWDILYRAPDAGTVGLSWHQSDGSGGLTNNEVVENATLIRYYLAQLGATNEAICGILGNLQLESGLDPNRYYGGVIGSPTAYGLPQFHPTSRYQDYAAAQGVDITDADQNGEFQLDCISQDLLGGWIPTTDYPYTWAQFLQLTDLETATRAFCFEYERPGPTFNPLRLTYAQQWYTFDWPADPGNPPDRFLWWLWGALHDLRRRKRI